MLVFVFFFFFFEPLDLLCAGHISWHCVIQGHRSWYCMSQASVSSESTILSFLSWRPTDSSTAILLPSLDTGCKLWQRIHSTALCLVTIGVSASSAQPSHSLRPAATSTGVPSVRPSRCLHLAAFNREFHQHALLTASPCGLQYGSSISMPFSLPSSCGLQRTLGSPTPSLAVAYGHDACISRLKQLVRCLSHSQKRRMYISSMCRTWSLRNIGLSIDPLPQGRTPHFHTFYCFACTIYAILLTRPKP